ncbi:hypothetical protein [Pseudomonas soli]|uniref:hypothetical protein n=1 Tax=Pseudomonas soli TaxID=1306993 RepID=UPI00345D5696
MLFIDSLSLDADASKTLVEMQGLIDGMSTYPEQVNKAKALWDAKLSSAKRKSAFRKVRDTLAKMCVGSVRCSYCEDSLADEIEHIAPKSLFPELTFLWVNYLFSCGPCNGPKSSRHGIVVGNLVQEFVRDKAGVITPPPRGVTALINPRSENPAQYLELDLGGVTPTGDIVEGTFEFVPKIGLSASDAARAQYTIVVLGLNREVIRAARENAFGGFRARLREYLYAKNHGESNEGLIALAKGILSAPHLTVFDEMRRQKQWLPQIDRILSDAPEIMYWRVF